MIAEYELPPFLLKRCLSSLVLLKDVTSVHHTQLSLFQEPLGPSVFHEQYLDSSLIALVTFKDVYNCVPVFS